MRNQRLGRGLSLVFSLALAFLALQQAANAQSTYVWNGVTTGSASWNVGGNWNPSSNYPGSTSGVFDIADFNANPTGAITVTAPASLYLNQLNFNQTTTIAGYTISGGTINLGGGTPTISVLTSGVTATIGSALAGTSGLTTTGLGTLVLTGANTYTGTTTVAMGTLQIGNGSSGSLNGTTGTALTFTGTGSFIVNEGPGSNQGMGALSFSGGAGTVTSSFTSGTATLTFSSLSPRAVGATGNFVLSGGTVGAPGSPGSNNIVITGQATGFIDTGTFFGGGNFAWYDSGSFVRGINWGADAGSTTVIGGSSLASTAYAQTTAGVTAQTSATFTALNIVNPNNSAQAFTLASGATVVTSGILLSGGIGASSVTTISGGTAIQAPNNGALVIRTDSVNDQLTISTPITANGANSLTKSGAGTLTLTTANTYNGGTYIDQGTLAITNVNSLSTGTVFFNGGTLQSASLAVTTPLNVPASQVGTLNLTSAGAIYGASSATAATTATLTINGTFLTTRTLGAAGAAVFNTAISGSGTLVVGNTNGTGGAANGSNGRAEFTNAHNFTNFTGSIQILSGANFAFPNAFDSEGGLVAANANNVTVNSGGFFSLIAGSGDIITPIGGLNGGGGVCVNSVSSPNRALLVLGNGNANGNFSGVINQSGLISVTAFLDVEKVGTGTQVFSGTNVYNGTTAIQNGILQLGTNSGGTVGSIGSGAGNTLTLGSGGNSGILELGDALNPASANFPSISISGTGTANAIVGGNANISTIAVNAAANDTFAGNLGGTGTNYNNLTLSKTGAATLTLSGTDTYVGATQIKNGTLQLGSPNALPVGSSVVFGTGSTGATLDLNGFNATVGGLGVGSSSQSNIIGSSSTTASSNLIFVTGTSVFPGTIQDTIGSGNQQLSLQVNSGNLTLSGSSPYSGPTTVGGGTLTLSVANALTNSPTVTVNSGVLNITAGSALPSTTTITVNGGTVNASATGALPTATTTMVNSTGSLVVQGGTTQSGAVMIANGGSFGVANLAAPTTTATMAANLTFGAATTDTTTLNLGAASDWTPTTSALLAVTGSLTLNGGPKTTTINISSPATLSVGSTYALISYQAPIGGTGSAAFVLGTLPNPRAIANLVDTGSLIELSVTGTDSPRWTGAVNNVWDINTTANWQLITAGTPTTYLQGDAVTFDDMATGPTAISLSAAVTPSGLTFNNSTKPYSISGSGSIGGMTTPLTISGGGVVTLATNNTYQGATTLTSGTLNLNSSGTGSTNSAIGTGTFIIGAGTTIDNTSGAAVTLATNNLQTWSGSFTFTGTNPLNLGTGLVTMTSNVTITANSASNPLTIGGSIGDGGSGFGITLPGPGIVTLGGNNSTFSGGVLLAGGQLNINGRAAIGTGPLTISGGTKIDNTSGVAITLSNNNAQNWNGNFVFGGSNQLNLGSGSITLGSNLTLTVNGGQPAARATFPNGTLFSSGVISDGGQGFTLSVTGGTGGGTLNLLTAAGTYSGGTNITNATIVLGNGTSGTENASALGSGPITLNSGGVLWAQPGGTSNLFSFSNTLNFNGGLFVGDDGIQHLGFGGAAITISGPSTSTIEATWANKPLYIDGLLQGTGSLLVQHGPTTTTPQGGIAQAQIHVSNSGNTYSGIISVSGTGTGGASLLIDAPTALQFATINTNPGTAGMLIVNTSSGATIAALTGNAGTVEPASSSGTYTLTLAGNSIAGNTNTYGGVLANNGSGILALTVSAAANQTQILTGVSSFTGATTINSGTLEIAGGGSIATTGSVAINGGALAFNLSGPASFGPSGGISGSGTIAQMGPGTLTLIGPNTFNGNVVVSGGILRLAASSIANTATVAVSDAGTLSLFNTNPASPATVTLGSLTLGSSTGANLDFELSGTPTLATVPLSVATSNGLTLVGTNTINVSNSQQTSVGTFPLIEYTGNQITSGLKLGSLPGRSTGQLVYGASEIDLKITSLGFITWTGVLAGSVWNTGTAIGSGGAFNWSFNGSPTNFFTGDSVVFDDSSASTAASPGQVNISGNVAPASVLFNNQTLAYTINGSSIVDGASPASVTIKGGGAVTLTNANSYSGGTNLLAGQLNINNAAAIGTGTLSIGAGTTIDNTSGAPITLASNNPMNWNGNFTFAGTNSLTFGTGTITLGGNVTLTMNGAQVNNRATFPVGTLTTSGTITDSGNNYALSVSSGTLNLLTAASTYSGGTNVTNATIILGNASAAATENVLAMGTGTITLNSGAVLWPQPGGTTTVYTFNNNFVFNGGTFDGEDGVQHIGTGGTTITINGPNTATLESNWANKPLFVDGLLQGSGNLLLQQGSTPSSPQTAVAPFTGTISAVQIHITNDSNTFSGIVSVSGAIPTGATTTGAWLLIDATTALQFATINTNPGVPGTVFINNSGGAIIAGLTGSAGKIEPVATLGTTSLTINTTGPNVYGGVLIDNTWTLALDVNGTGSLTLSGNNTFSGGTTLTSAQLNINSATAIGTGQFTIDSGTIDNTSGAPITNSNNNSMNWNGSFIFGGTNPLNLGTGAVSISSSLTVTTNGTSAAPLTVGGVITDNGGGYSLTKAGPGTLILTGVNTYSGGTTIIGGELNINSDSALGAATAPLNLNGGALQFAAGGGVNLGASRPVILGGGAFDTNSGYNTVSSALSGSSTSNSNLIVFGGGALTLNAVNTYAGSTSVNGAFLIVPAGTNISGGALNVSNTNTATPPTESGLFLYNAAQTVGSLSGTITQPGSGNTATIFLNTGTTLTVDQTAAGTFQGNIYGGGNLATGPSSNNTLQLSGNSTYTGTTTINGGTVQLNVSNALPASTALSFAASVGSGTAATLNLNNNDQQVASLSGGSSTSGFIQTGSGVGGILTVVNPAGGSTTYGGVISGAGGLALGLNNTDGPNDTAALVLTGPNSFTGPVTVNSGTLRAGANWVLNGGVVMPTQPPFGPLPTPYPGTFTLAASANATFDLNNFNVAIGSLQGGGPAGGNITLGNGTGSPGTGGTLQIIQSQVTIYAGVISGNGNLIVGSSAGGRLILAGHNTYNGSTYSDVIVIATNNALPTNNNVIFGSGSTDGLDLNGFNQQVSTILGGAATNDGGIGTIVDSASGHSVLTLAYAASNPPPSGSPTAFTGVIANDVNVVIDAAIVGGTQTVEFSGPNNTTGALTVGARSNSTSSGVANALTIDTAASVFSALTIGNGFASNLRNSVTVASSGSLSVGSVTIGDSAAGGTGSNTLNVNGPVTVSGAITIGNAIASSTSANSVVVGSGGTLNAGSLVMGGSANPYGVNTASIASGGTLLLSSPTIVGDDAHQKGSGSMIVNGSLGNATAPIAIGGLTIEAGGVLGGSGTVTTSNTGAPITISQGLVRGGADGTGNNPLGTLTITPVLTTNAAKANPVTITGTGTPGLNQTGGILTEVQRTGAGTASASLISILGTNKGLNLNTGGTAGFSSINLVLSDPTASMVPGEAYTINVAQVFTVGAIRVMNTNQPAGTVIDFSNTAAAQASGTPVVGPSSGQNTNVDLYITGNNNYSNSVASWSLAVDPTGKILQLSLVSSAVPEPEHLLLVCAGALLAGLTIRRRWSRARRFSAAA